MYARLDNLGWVSLGDRCNLCEERSLKVYGWLFFLMWLSLAVRADEATPHVFRIGYGLSEQSHQGRAVRFFADEVAKRSGGTLLVRPIGDAALGPDIQMQQSLISGTQEMMIGASATLIELNQQMALWDTPFLFRHTDEVDAILDGPIGQRVLEGLADTGVIGLVYWENGFRQVTNATRPLIRMEDFDGLRLRVMQNPLHLQSFKSLGVDAVPLPFSELYAALENHLVDGQENPVMTILSSQFFKTQSYLSMTNHVYSPWVMLASQQWWDARSVEQQRIIIEAAQASRAFQRAHAREEDQKALVALQSEGMQINSLTAAEQQRLQLHLCQIHAEIAQRVGETLWSETQHALNLWRASNSTRRFFWQTPSSQDVMSCP